MNWTWNIVEVGGKMQSLPFQQSPQYVISSHSDSNNNCYFYSVHDNKIPEFNIWYHIKRIRTSIYITVIIHFEDSYTLHLHIAAIPNELKSKVLI